MVQGFEGVKDQSISARKTPLHGPELQGCYPTLGSFMSSQDSREFPFSYHDNRRTLRDISLFNHVSMRGEKKSYETLITTLQHERRQRRSRTLGCGAKEVL